MDTLQAHDEAASRITNIEEQIRICLGKLCNCYKIAYIPSVLISLDMAIESLCRSMNAVQRVGRILHEESTQHDISERVSFDAAIIKERCKEALETIGNPVPEDFDCARDLELLSSTASDMEKSISSWIEGLDGFSEAIDSLKNSHDKICEFSWLLEHVMEKSDMYKNYASLNTSVIYSRASSMGSIIVN